MLTPLALLGYIPSPAGTRNRERKTVMKTLLKVGAIVLTFLIVTVAGMSAASAETATNWGSTSNVATQLWPDSAGYTYHDNGDGSWQSCGRDACPSYFAGQATEALYGALPGRGSSPVGFLSGGQQVAVSGGC